MLLTLLLKKNNAILTVLFKSHTTLQQHMYDKTLSPS